MKTPTLSGSVVAVLFSIAMPCLCSAQTSSVQFTSIQRSSGSNWLGNNEVVYSKTNLVWQVPPTQVPVSCEVEYSTDMVHFVSAGEVGKPETSSNQLRRFTFQHNTTALKTRGLIQYRIKLIDISGKVIYSEVKTTHLDS